MLKSSCFWLFIQIKFTYHNYKILCYLQANHKVDIISGCQCVFTNSCFGVLRQNAGKWTKHKQWKLNIIWHEFLAEESFNKFLIRNFWRTPACLLPLYMSWDIVRIWMIKFSKPPMICQIRQGFPLPDSQYTVVISIVYYSVVFLPVQ